MLPFQLSSGTFRRDQRPTYSVSFWDTTCTVPQTGMGFALFDVEDLSLDLLSTAYSTHSALEALLNNQTKLTSILGYSGGVYRSGLEPNMDKYWGAGAPPGCHNSQRVFLKYSGTVVATDFVAHPITLVFGGQGKVRVWKNGAELTNGRIREPLTHAAPGTSEVSIENEAGYIIVETSVTQGDLIEVYYCQNGEVWGGFFGKVLPAQGLTTSWSTFRTALRDAPIIGAGFLAASTATAVKLPYIITAGMDAAIEQIRQFTMEVALNDLGKANGFVLENVGGMNQLTDNRDPSLVIRPGRLVHTDGGFQKTGGAEEVYPRFTGNISSITPSSDGMSATILCQGFENKIEGVYDENYPDMLAYLANGYIDREWLGFPVYPISAFDAWPLEAALATLCYRAGIDATNLGKSPYTSSPTYGRWGYTLYTSQTAVSGQARFWARALADSTQLIYLQRNKNYGNIGVLQKDYLPKDDAYLFASRVSDRLFDRTSLLATQYGYDFYFDASGQATIASRNNPQSWQYLSLNGDTTQSVNPSAIGGRYYRNITGAGSSAWTKQVSAFCSRIDLYLGLGVEAATLANGGLLTILVEVHQGVSWQTVLSKTISTFRAASESFFYDDILDQKGNNLSVVTLFNLPFDEYRVTLSHGGVDLADVNPTALLRLNGVAVFERDPSTSPYPANLSTLANVTELRAISNEKDIRNQVIVVGQRKATVTDSQKFLAQDNPNNPFTEFFVSVAADPSSIYDPTAPNFQGGKKVTVIVDEKVTDGDFAKWLARTVLFRSNMPNLSAELTHTPLPMLEVRDPIRVVNEKQDNMPYTVWVESIKEVWGMDGDAEVQIHVTAYAELPSYTPREDIDISLFQFSPAYNISASYKNIYGNVVSNPPLPATMPTMSRVSTAVTSGTTMALPANMAPDDIYMEHPTNLRGRKRLSNHPYRHFHHISGIAGSGNTRTYTLTFDFQEGDGTAGVYDKASYGFPTSWLLYGDQWVDRSAGAGTSATINPFYDPYTSEVNNLVSLKFDSLVSGFYRVSLWAATDHGEYDFPVAWLTKPEGDAEDIEAHWQYLEAGAGREFLWDGVDNIGLWNRYQTRDFARIHEGNFLDKSIAIGKGFYAANDQSTSINTQIGDQTTNNYDATGMPFFAKGRYGRFYLKIEAKSDRLTRTGATEIYSVNSHNDLKILSTPFYVFSHLGEPSQSYLAVEEWDDTVDKWVVGTALSHWSTINQSSGAPVIRNGKPVRVTFQPVARRGVLFYNEVGVADSDKWSGQLARVAHMKINVFDQFWTFYGKPWDGDIDTKNKPEQNANNQEAKRLTNRMASDDTHTVLFESDDWMSGKDMKNLQWVFMPFYFQKDWGDGVKEQIRYGDYEQLYSLPGYDYAQGGGTDRKDKAFINMAFMNYLFYLSAMTLDRSGRRQWCINPNFIDKSKIVTSTWLAATSTPQYTTKYERFGADIYLQRSHFVRQWIEPTWKTSSGGFLALSPVDAAHPGTGGITNAFELQWVQPSILDFDPPTSPMASAGTEDTWMTAYTTQNSQVMKDFWLQATSFLTFQVRPYYKGYPTHTHNYAVSGFGAWNFNRYIYSGWFKPSPCRDFHPYWREPGMPDWGTAWPGYTIDGIDNAANLGVNIMESSSSHYGSAMRDFAAQSNWFGFAYSDLYFPGVVGSNLDWRGARLEEDVIAWAKQGNKFAEMANVFDYVKQDTLNRFDHFRGVFSRSPFARRKDINAATDIDWWNGNERRQAGTQPVSPSGQYLMNLGNYKDYLIAPCTSKQYREDANFLHFTHDVSTFYDIRFRHEFIWQNNRYFPVYPNGGNKYWAFKSERTGLATGTDLYDAGAWTGWKDDITSASWTTDPHLRWSELYGASSDNANQQRSWVDGTLSSKAFHSGGYGNNSVGSPLAATGAISYQQKVMGTSALATRWFTRTNIIADTFGSQRLRLAVGPRTPETRSLTMNLVLPYRLSH